MNNPSFETIYVLDPFKLYLKWSILQINRLNCNISVTPDLCSVDHLLIFILYSIDWVQILAQGEERSFSKFTIYLLIQPDV